MNWKRVWVSLLCICFTLLLFDNLLAQDRPQPSQRRMDWQPEMEIGDTVRDFELPILGGGTFKLSEQKGKIVVMELGACT
ncbi:hypothetical protein AMJ80_11740 [bacterium SM23_31]|nr:MAG: hypothetical protein AMJ80_11740 [bacterium SM23_31]